MWIAILLFAGLAILFGWLWYRTRKNLKSQEAEAFQSYLLDSQSTLDSLLEDKRSELSDANRALERLTIQRKAQQDLVNQGQSLVNMEVGKYRSEQMAKVDIEMEQRKGALEVALTKERNQLEEEIARRELDSDIELVRQVVEHEDTWRQFHDNYVTAYANFQKEEEEMNAILEAHRQHIDEINRQIANQKELETEQTKFQICLDSTELNDIKVLTELAPRLNRSLSVRKIIWSEYLQPAFKEMIKQQFGADVPQNIIYCIENTETKEKYIGKTTQLASKRWADHIKSSLGIVGTCSSKFHQALNGNWEHFTFRVLARTDKDNIDELEKFYIDLFNTDRFGYNMKIG